MPSDTPTGPYEVCDVDTISFGDAKIGLCTAVETLNSQYAEIERLRAALKRLMDANAPWAGNVGAPGSHFRAKHDEHKAAYENARTALENRQ